MQDGKCDKTIYHLHVHVGCSKIFIAINIEYRLEIHFAQKFFKLFIYKPVYPDKLWWNRKRNQLFRFWFSETSLTFHATGKRDKQQILPFGCCLFTSYERYNNKVDCRDAHTHT